MDFLSLLRSGGLSGTDSPDGFVGNHNLAKLLGSEVEQTVGYLSLHHIELAAGLALLQHLAAAHDRLDAIFQQLVHLAGYNLVGLMIIGAALAVSHNAVVNIHRLQHGGRHFAGVGAALLVAHILCTDHKVRVVAIVRNHLQIGEWRADNHLSVGVESGFLHLVHNTADQVVSLLERLVHLPVSCNNVFSHDDISFIVYCFKFFLFFTFHFSIYVVPRSV